MGSSNSGRCLIPMASRGLRVLLVDEDTSSLMDIASVLEEQSYKVRTTQLASVALSMIQEGEDQFDLVMADTNMRGMNVFTFLGCILLKTDMSIIFMSSNENMDMARKALSEGACFFFHKPIRKQDLINVWQHVYRKRTSQKIKNQKEEKDSHDRKIVMLDRMLVVSRNDLHGHRNDRLPIYRGNEDEKNKDCLLDGDRMQDLQEICKEQMMMVEKVKQGESSRIQGIKTMEKDTCSGNIESMGLGLVEGDHAKQSLHTTQIVDMKKSKRDISNRKRVKNDYDSKSEKRGDLKRSNSKGLKFMEDDCSKKKNTGNSSTEKRSRMKWTPALHLKFMDAICGLGERKTHPKVVRRMMNEPDLTIRHVASHLQKYRERVNLINSAADLPVVQPKMIGVANKFHGASKFHAQHDSTVHSQGFTTPNSEIGAAATQFTSLVPLPNPGLNVGSSVHYNLEKLRQALFYKNLTKKAHASFPNNFNGVKVANKGELHGLNNLSTASASSNATNPSANQNDEQLLGFDVNIQDINCETLELDCSIDFSDLYGSFETLPNVHQQDPFQEWNPPPCNLQNSNQLFPMALPGQLTQETNFSRGLNNPTSSRGCVSTSFADLLKLLDEDEEGELFNGQPKEEEEDDIERYIEWIGTPPESDNDLPK